LDRLLPVDLAFQVHAEHMGLDYWIINNHTISGNTPQSNIPGKNPKARLAFKETVLSRILEVGAASAASRGLELQREISVIAAGDWNLKLNSVEEAMMRSGATSWWLVGTERDFIFSTVPMQCGIQSKPSVAHDRFHTAVLGRAMKCRSIRLISAESVNRQKMKHLASKLIKAFRDFRSLKLEAAERLAQEEEQAESARQDLERSAKRKRLLDAQQRQAVEQAGEQAEEERRQQEAARVKEETRQENELREAAEMRQAEDRAEEERRREEEERQRDEDEEKRRHDEDEAPIEFHRSSCRLSFRDRSSDLPCPMSSLQHVDVGVGVIGCCRVMGHCISFIAVCIIDGTLL
jgi:flagellar biosynthesis GTPase FlhF